MSKLRLPLLSGFVLFLKRARQYGHAGVGRRGIDDPYRPGCRGVREPGRRCRILVAETGRSDLSGEDGRFFLAGQGSGRYKEFAYDPGRNVTLRVSTGIQMRAAGEVSRVRCPSVAG